MVALGGFEVQVESAGGWVGTDGCVAGVGERTGLACAETCEVVFVSAECLSLVGEREFVGAVLVGYDLPGDLVGGHCRSPCVR